MGRGTVPVGPNVVAVTKADPTASARTLRAGALTGCARVRSCLHGRGDVGRNRRLRVCVHETFGGWTVVRHSDDLRGRMRAALETALRDRLAEVAPAERAALADTIRREFTKALHNAPTEEDAVSQMEARAMLAAALDGALLTVGRRD